MSRRADRFVESLCSEAFDSDAVNHPYLRALAAGDFPDYGRALQDFAYQYEWYSAGFTDYVSAVIGQLKNAKHQQILESNLAEEQGSVEGVVLDADLLADIAGRSHTSLYADFQSAVGVDAAYRETAKRCALSSSWRQQFLSLCQMNECAGVGAIGIGTELIVSRIYGLILEGLTLHSAVTPAQRVFFDLHSHCDEEHAAQMLYIAKDLARSSTACQQLRYGADTALALRAAFWDEMLNRAQAMPTAGSTAAARPIASAH